MTVPAGTNGRAALQSPCGFHTPRGLSAGPTATDPNRSAQRTGRGDESIPGVLVIHAARGGQCRVPRGAVRAIPAPTRTSVDPQWRDYFAGLGGRAGEIAHGPLVEELAQRARLRRPGGSVVMAAPETGSAAKQGAVSRMIQIYANRGHLIANIDPLGLMQRPVPKVMGLDYLGLTEGDLDTEFLTGSRNTAIKPRLKLREIIERLKHIYCGTIGAEFVHV
ncbi:MAG: hypothetical protein MZV65_25520 [Chromatiales bacterium]|nr:hypothetical protein [Chromatiales bacterium]